MMRSVSMSSPRTGSARPRISARRAQRPRTTSAGANSRTSTISPAIGGRRNHRGAHQQRASGRAALPALEVPVRRGGADLAAFEAIGVHRQAHRASRAAPLESGVEKHAIEPLALRSGPHRLRSRHDERLHVRRDVLPADRPARPRAGPRAARWCTSRRTRRRSASPSSPVPRGSPMNASASGSAFAGSRSSTPRTGRG